MQRTLKTAVEFKGVGLHSGQPVNMRVLPAPAGHGIQFLRTDIGGSDAFIIARWDFAHHVPLCTMLVNHAGVSVSTVEHLMAALSGCGVTNALVKIDGPEVPILDGSAAEFVARLLDAGVIAQNAPLRVVEVLKPVSVKQGAAEANLMPAKGFEIAFSIDFPDAAIGRQTLGLDMANGTFVRELCDSRTFCRKADVDDMRQSGRALGGTLENALVVDGADILTPGGARHDDEPVRHKMLDAMGDLALAGAPIIGRYVGNRAGHSLTNALLRELFATPGAYRFRVADDAVMARLPGVGLTTGDLQAVA